MPEATDVQAPAAILTGSAKPFDRAAALRALDSLLEGDDNEQRETLEWLKRALDQDRLPGSRLFS